MYWGYDTHVKKLISKKKIKKIIKFQKSNVLIYSVNNWKPGGYKDCENL